MRLLLQIVALTVLVGSAPALAQRTAGEVTEGKSAPPAAPKEGPAEGEVEEIQVQELVIAAMKAKTRVQEAPAIVSVITDEQMRNLGYLEVADAVGALPGFLNYGWLYGLGPNVGPQGILQGALIMRDGLDLFDMSGGINAINQAFPIEMMKRVELISGPAGVLWGSNSFLGIVNMVSKTADDFRGVEAFAGWGTGPGQPSSLRTYVMAGNKLFGGRLKVLGHVGYRTWFPQDVYSPYRSVAMTAAPSPMGPLTTVGAESSDSGQRSHYLVFDGNAQLGPVFLRWSIPWSHQRTPFDWGGNVAKAELPEDQINCANPANKLACSLRVDPDRVGRSNGFSLYSQYALLGWRDAFLENKLQLEARGFYIRHAASFDRYIFPTPTNLAPGGVVLEMNFNNHRAGFSFDGNATLPRSTRLLFGGELYYDYLPRNVANFLSSEETMNTAAPFRCPRDASGKIITDADGNYCPLVTVNQTDRLTGGVFVNGQSRIIPQVTLDAGARVQFYGGKRSASPVALFSGGAVWSFLPRWNLKASYADGFRPPALHRMDSVGDALTWAGSPYLEVERSRAVQGEINTRLLQGYRSIRQLSLRADYSYIWLDNFIEVNQGIYQNFSKIGIHSAELLADLTLKEGHWFSLGYTFLDGSNSEKGKLRSMPNQWMSLRAVLNLWANRLLLGTTLMVIGGAEDYNRTPNPELPSGDVRTGEVDASGGLVSEPTLTSRVTDMAIDRINPAAIWNASLRFLMPRQGLQFSADVYNILNAATYHGDSQMDQSAFLEFLPAPRPGVSFMLNARYTL